MFFVITETIAPLLSLFIFILGNGFFSTLLALAMALNHEAPMAIGALTGVFYAGLVFGSFRIERFITRIGHIRAYSVFSASLAVICLIHGLHYNLWLWLILRFAAGFVTAGLFVVIESWLLCKSTPQNRGQVLSLYMITFFAGQSLGQFFLNLGDPGAMSLYVVASMMCSLSIIPLSMTSVRSPEYDEPSTLSLKKILKQSTSGLLGCLSSGMIMAGIYGLMPLFLNNLFHHKAAVANYMFTIIFGGMLLQYPIGKLSDILARRLVLIYVAIATICISLLVILFKADTPFVFFFLMLFVGGLTFTLYPISISHACDSFSPKDMVAGTQSLLLAYSIGAMVGPFVASIFMHVLGDQGLFVYFISICALTIPILIIRKAQKSDIPQEDAFVSIPQTSPILMELDPRGESS